MPLLWNDWHALLSSLLLPLCPPSIAVMIKCTTTVAKISDISESLDFQGCYHFCAISCMLALGAVLYMAGSFASSFEWCIRSQVVQNPTWSCPQKWSFGSTLPVNFSSIFNHCAKVTSIYHSGMASRINVLSVRSMAGRGRWLRGVERSSAVKKSDVTTLRYESLVGGMWYTRVL